MWSLQMSECTSTYAEGSTCQVVLMTSTYASLRHSEKKSLCESVYYSSVCAVALFGWKMISLSGAIKP